MRMLRALLVLPLLLGAAGCGDRSSDAGEPGSTASLAPGTWVVTAIADGGRDHPLVPGTQIRLRFDEDRLVITAVCNTMSGTYTLDGTRLSVTAMATTEMGCAEPLMAQDAWVSGLFTEPVQVATGKEATITAGQVVLSLAPRTKVSPDVALTGTHWVLDTVVAGETASSVPAGVSAWFRIDGDTLSLSDGCNSGGGRVRIDGQTLRFSAVAMTQMACPGAGGIPEAVGRVFTGVATYQITEQHLTLTRGGHGLGFRAVQARR